MVGLAMNQSNILRHLGVDVHGHAHGGVHAAHGPEATISDGEKTKEGNEDDKSDVSYDQHAAAQIIGVAILEFGVLLHRLV